MNTQVYCYLCGNTDNLTNLHDDMFYCAECDDMLDISNAQYEDEPTNPGTIKVYRFEDEDGRGPYNSTNSFNDELIDMHADRIGLTKVAASNKSKYIHPGNIRNWYSSMNSLRELDNWFAEFTDMLFDEGYECVVYEVIDHPKYRHKSPDGQVFFRRDRARRVNL